MLSVRNLATTAAMLAALVVAGCGGDRKQVGDENFVTGFAGGVAADEPRAAIVGRDILGRGGTAADAATAMFFTLAVTKPSAVSIGGVGGCVYFDAPNTRFSAFDFMPAPAKSAPGGRPEIATPLAVRGMAALHARHGALAWAELVGPAEALARFGHAVSRSLAGDLAAAGPTLLNDPGMRQVFQRPDGGLAKEGDRIQQLQLAGSLAQIRQRGAGAMHTGVLAQAYLEGVAGIGGVLSATDLRQATPRAVQPILRKAGNQTVAFMPTLSSNGPQQARLWRILAENGELESADRDARLHLIAEASVLAHSEFAKLVRAGGSDIDQFDEAAIQRLEQRFAAFDPNRAQSAAFWLDGTPPVPTETSGSSIVAIDRAGSAAACGFTLFRNFGAGRLLQGVGAAPALAPPPGIVSSALGPIVVGNAITTNGFLAISGSGASASTSQVAIAARMLLGDEAVNAAVGSPRFSRGGGVATIFVEQDVGAASRAALQARGYTLEASPPIARVNAAFCKNGLPRDPDSCDIRTDWRGDGLASSAK